jgi:hypothetical protein
MRLGFFFAATLAASTSWAADQKLGIELEASAGPIWSLAGQCQPWGNCGTPPDVVLRVGYELLSFASVGARASATLGPTGRTFCPGPILCGGAYRAWSILFDARLHTIGTSQLTIGTAVGVSRLISLQCRCEEIYETTGARLPTIEFALGVRTYLSGGPIHLGVEGRYSAMFGADSPLTDPLSGRAVPNTMTVSSIAALFVLGSSL